MKFWWRWRNLPANFALKDFYAQIIEKFVVAIPDMIESHRSTKKSQEIKKCQKIMRRPSLVKSSLFYCLSRLYFIF